MCIRVLDSANAYVYSYPVLVDKLTVLQISNISSIVNIGENMTLSVEMNNITSADIVQITSTIDHTRCHQWVLHQSGEYSYQNECWIHGCDIQRLPGL